MDMEITHETGKLLIEFARQNIEHYLNHGKPLPVPSEIKEKFDHKSGAFVTLSVYEKAGNPLRGCIGYILPYFPLWETVSKVSIAAAVDDPRFPAVKIQDMERIIVEVSVLTVPKQILVKTPNEYLSKIQIGRDGLIVSQDGRQGLLLPQVPVEHGRNWDVQTFLEHTCEKAWLPRNAWKDLKSTKIEHFTATIFEETSPGGEIRKKEIGE
ncbi:MAG: TIGR00296 family protein [Promethearchaeota archaeon]|nr:MAG: TIGR00296 family protein [Candidatus Lokiarchaeota archaeon]